MRQSIRQGEAYGLEVMKFTLVFEGDLKANGNATAKQVIREKFHPQLAELWKDDPRLKSMQGRRYISTDQGGLMWWENHHSIEVTEPEIPHHQAADGSRIPASHIDLCEPILKKGISFLPLVRDRTALRCALKIFFLRNEPPGGIYTNGDIDNRLKTLLDALSVPQHDEQVVQCASPMYCLLEDDNLITAIDVQTHRRLAGPHSSVNYVHMLIEVDVRVVNPRGYNQMFLGD